MWQGPKDSLKENNGIQEKFLERDPKKRSSELYTLSEKKFDLTPDTYEEMELRRKKFRTTKKEISN
jgi:hypothetical protein